MAVTPEQAKAASEAFLRERGLPVNERLPALEDPSELAPRSGEDVARRIAVLNCVIGIAYGRTGSQQVALLRDHGLLDAASAAEKSLLASGSFTQQQQIDAKWLAECVQALAWCLGLVGLDPFRRCDDDLASHFPRPNVDPGDFIRSARLRPFDEVYLQADLHCRLHWAARESRLRRTPSRLDEEIVTERRRALDWAVGVERDWDEVSLDT